MSNPQPNVVNGKANPIRWTHAESEDGSISRHSDRMIHADISGWSHATSKPFGSVFKPIRPEVGRIPRVSHPIASIEAAGALYANPPQAKPHDPKEISLPCDSEEAIKSWQDKRAQGPKVALTSAIMAERFYKDKVVSHAEPIKEIDPEWIPISKEELEKLKLKNIQVPRDEI